MTGLPAPLRHPGPPVGPRAQAQPCRARPLRLRLAAGQSLSRAIPAALARAGFAAGYLRLDGAVFRPLDYVIPAPAPGDGPAAWYSPTRRLAGKARVLHGGVHAGLRDGAAFLHCHGTWQADAGAPAMGHMLCPDSMLAEPCTLRGWGLDGAALVAWPDRETGFVLFRPEARPTARSARPAAGARAVLLTLRPNQDLGPAIAAAARRHGLATARIEGIGSLIGTTFDTAAGIDSYATEFLIREGALRAGRVGLHVASVGFDGRMRTGWLAPGRNAVCVTAELLLIAAAPAGTLPPTQRGRAPATKPARALGFAG